VLDSATDYAQFMGGLDGIDGVYLSAFSSAGRNLNLAGGSVDRASDFLDQYGLPGMAGGGAAHSFINDIGGNSAALVGHDSLKSQLEGAHGNPLAKLDILAREAFGAAAGAAESLLPGSGAYVQGAGTLLVSTAEGIAWGAGIGAGIGAFFGTGGAAVGAAVGAIIGGIIGLIEGIVELVSGAGKTAEVAKGDKVPVSPPAPVTDSDGKTTKVGPDGHAAPGRPTGGQSPPPPSGQQPGPKAKEVHCPRGDDDLTPELTLPAWGRDFDMIPVLAPDGPGFASLVSGGTSAHLAPAAQVAIDAQIASTGVWGDLMIKRAGPGQGELGAAGAGRLATIVEISRRAQLAESLSVLADQAATLEDALTTLRRSAR
jgi:hypothetical protein